MITRMSIALAVFAAVGLATTASVQAYDAGQNITGQPEIVEALTDAKAYWGGRVACPAGIAVDVVDFADAPEAATAGNCRISVGIAWLNATPDRTRFCALFAHEYGHLLGYGHEPNPRDVDGVMVNNATPRYCRTFGMAELVLPRPCRWPEWTRTTPAIRKLYAARRFHAARTAFRSWRKHHPHAKLPGPCRATGDGTPA